MSKVKKSVTLSEETMAWIKKQIKKKRFKDMSHASARSVIPISTNITFTPQYMENRQNSRFKVILKRNFSELDEELHHALQFTFNNNEQALWMECKHSFSEKNTLRGRLKS
jgi:hypothetical protein